MHLLLSMTVFLLAQMTPSPAPQASATPAANADLSKLSPAQQAAVQAYIIKASQNPVGNIAIIPFQFNNNYGIGPYARYQFNVNIQPVVPLMLSKNMTLIARTIIPIVDNPSNLPPTLCPPDGVCGSTFGVSDIQEQLFFAPKAKPGAMIWGAGPIFQFPTASPGVPGTGKWSVGPDAVALVMPGSFVIGVLVTQVWSFAGKVSAPEVNSGLIQPFINYNLKGAWALTTAPILTANYAAPGNQKWSIPVGGGVSKTFKLGDQPMQIGVYYYTYVERPISTPQNFLRFTWNLLFPIKRGFDLQEILQESGVK
ncbi:MAG: hypothetical protein WBD74_10915 [Candidatus Aquilonibacter sp.]